MVAALTVVDGAAPVVADVEDPDEAVVDDAANVVDEEPTGAEVDDVVVDSWSADVLPPLEHPAPASATVNSRTRNLIDAHHRAPF